MSSQYTLPKICQEKGHKSEHFELNNIVYNENVFLYLIVKFLPVQ